MAGESRSQPPGPRGTGRWSELRWGQAPVCFVAFVTVGLLWGTGHNLPSAGFVLAGGTDLRTGVAWLALMAVLLAVAFPMLSLAMSLMRGPQPRNRLVRTLIGWYLRRSTARQLRRRERLMASYEAERPGTSVMPLVARYFPLDDPLRSTALGNVEAALAERVRRTYHLDLELAWPLLDSLIPEQEHARLAAAKRQADVAGWSAAGWLVATIEVTPIIWLFALFGMTGSTRLWVPGFVAASVAFTLIFYATRYSQAVRRAVQHGRLVETTVALHRMSIFDKLGLRRPEPGQEEEFFAFIGEFFSPGDPGRATTFTADLQGTVAQVLREEMDKSLRKVEKIGETFNALRQDLEGPELDNFDGDLSVSVQDDLGTVPVDDEGKAIIHPGHDCRLVVTIGSGGRDGSFTAPLRIRGGRDSEVVPFGVSVDSNVPAFRLAEQEIQVRAADSHELEVPLNLERAPARPVWLWVRVTQRGRTIQNIELELNSAAAAGSGWEPGESSL